MAMTLRDILHQVAGGEMDVFDAEKKLAGRRLEADLGFARIDLQRAWRCGVPEAVYGEGKLPSEIAASLRAVAAAGQPALATRVDPVQAQLVQTEVPDAIYHHRARMMTLAFGSTPQRSLVGRVAVVCAGTSDLPVAEEAMVAAQWIGSEVELVPDVGVAGLHRLTRRLDRLDAANVLVVVAGMEAALPSVVGGLVDRPMIAVPTSVGYGLNMHGLSTLLAMLNSCVPGVTVVNVDNGFGAGVAAGRINRMIAAGPSADGPQH
jgi:NCAIR mutase (PurE)-related protein